MLNSDCRRGVVSLLNALTITKYENNKSQRR